MEYNLLKAQTEFLEIPHSHKLDVALYQGGFGSGKTWSGSLLGIILCKKYPGIRGLVGAQTFPLVRDTTLVSYLEHLDTMGYKKGIHYEYLKAEAKLKFNNGSEILFRYFEDDTKIKSLNLGFVEVEEMSDIPESTFKMLLGRLRQAGIPKYRLFGHTNPESTKGWIYKTFIENPKPNYRLIIAPSTQNIYLPENFVDELKKAYDPEYFRINVLGEFGDYSSGLVTKGFSTENIKEINYLEDEKLYISCDFNKDPMCWVLAHIDWQKNKIYFFDELVVENTDVEQTTNILLEKYGNHKTEIIICGDASGDWTNAGDLRSYYFKMRNKLQEHGYIVKFKLLKANPKKGAAIESWNAKIFNASGERSILIDPKCKWLIYNIYNLKYKPGTSEIDEPSKTILAKDRNSKFLMHIFQAAYYIVHKLWPIRNLKDKAA